MQKTVLNDVFELLQQIGAVSSESEFSRDWRARSECCMPTLRLKQANPRLAIFTSKILHCPSCMTATDSHKQLGKKFIKLSE